MNAITSFVGHRRIDATQLGTGTHEHQETQNVDGGRTIRLINPCIVSQSASNSGPTLAHTL